METKSFFARTEDAVLDFFCAVAFLLAANPVSMFLSNLLIPEVSARFVKEFIGFNDFWRKFYTKLALKWPLMWSKHWITPDNLKICGLSNQITYFWGNYYERNVRWREMTLKAMSSEAQVALIRKHYDHALEFGKLMRLTDEMFDEWLRQIVKNGRKFGHNQRLYEPLSNYLKTGKLPYRQVDSLERMAVDNYESTDILMKLFLDYIERFGLDRDDLNKFAQYMCDNLYWSDTFGEEPITGLAKEFKKQDKFNHFFNMLNERQINYEQRVFTKSQRGPKQTDEWLKFCEKTQYICVAAQKEMGLDQYHVFHATGHTLNKEAIFTFLRYPDRNLHRIVFQYEPWEIFLEEDLYHFIHENVYLQADYDLS